MWLAAFFIHASAITIFLESCLVLLNHPHRPARNNSLEPRRKPSKTFSRTSWYVWYECNLKQQIECNSCSLLHTHTCYPGPACHEGVCTSSLLVSVDAPGCQPSAACSKKSQHGLKRKHYFMQKQKMIKKYVSSADLGTTHLAIRNESSWVWKPMQPKFLSSGPKLFASLLGRLGLWPLLDRVILTNCPSNEQALALVPEACLDFGCEVGPCRCLKYASVQRFPRRTQQLLQLSVGALRKPFTIPTRVSECRNFWYQSTIMNKANHEGTGMGTSHLLPPKVRMSSPMRSFSSGDHLKSLTLLRHMRL